MSAGRARRAKRPEPRATAGESPGGEKLQKILARAGVGSRREMERWIEQGRISVDGSTASLGDRVLPGQVIRVDGQALSAGALVGAKRRILVYNKPEGEICTASDPEGRATIFDRLPALRNGRWVAVGRLDINTQGLILLTTDGELANRLMHPSGNIEREYAVRVLGAVGSDMLERLRHGIELEDGPAHFDSIIDAGGEGANHWYHVTLREGRNREVRRLWEAVGVKVSRLIRVRYGLVTLPRGLRPGRWADLEAPVAEQLAQSVGYVPRPQAPDVRRRTSGASQRAHAVRGKQGAKQRSRGGQVSRKR